MEKIKCSSCGEMLPANAEHFKPRKNRKRGFSYSCKKCANSKLSEKTHKKKEEKYKNITEKICTKCKMTKKIEEFRKRKDRKYGVYPCCKECEKIFSTEYRKNNKDIIKNKAIENREIINSKNREYYKINKEKILNRCYEYRKNNSEIVKERLRNHYKNNKEMYSLSSRRRELNIKNVSINFGELSDFIIQESYKLRDLRNALTNIIWHVDHIVPLKSELVCGLHCGFNLRVIPAEYNLKKGNRYWDDMPDYSLT